MEKWLDVKVGEREDGSAVKSDELFDDNKRLYEALEAIREYERVVNPGSKSWSIANSALYRKD